MSAKTLGGCHCNEKLIKLKTALPGLVAFVMLAAIITYHLNPISLHYQA